MNIKTRNKLEELGANKKWLDDIKKYWTPKSNGKYEILITDIEDLNQDPRDGIFVERTRFSNDKDLSRIHVFFEGCAYVMTEVNTGELIGEGIIDGAPFEEMSEFTEEEWFWQETNAEKEMKKSW